jgi:acyl carrier protein
MDVKGQIRRFLISEFHLKDAQLKDSTLLLEEGLLDSVATMDLIIFLEETFGISVAEEEVLPANLGSVDRIAAFVAEKQGSVSRV